MKNIIVIFAMTMVLQGVLAPPAEANRVSDAVVSVKDVVVDTVYDAEEAVVDGVGTVVSVVGEAACDVSKVGCEIIGSSIRSGINAISGLMKAVIERTCNIVPDVVCEKLITLWNFVKPVVEPVIKWTNDHPILTSLILYGVGEFVPKLLSIKRMTTGVNSSVVIEERCFVAARSCGMKIPKELRDPSRDLKPFEKEALKDRACGPKWCISELTGKKFPRPEAHIDHIVPHSLGGNTSIENSQVISQTENLAKGAKLPA